MATVTTLQLKSSFFSFQGEQFNSTATAGDATQLTDSSLKGYISETWPAKLEGSQIRITGGLASGDLRMVGDADRSDGILYPNRNFSAAVANTDPYELWGTAIAAGVPLTTLFNDVMRTLRPVQDTQVTIVTNQNQYDVTATVQSKRDIRGVYLRSLDPGGLVPYRINELSPGLEWTAYDRGGGGTTAVFLELRTALTLNTTAIQLWIRAETGFVALVDDTSTVDAVYRDWLPWEAIFELTQRRLNTTSADKGKWQALHDRALPEVSDGRNRWMPREPIPVGVFW